jgi:hypothetical protein
MGDHIIKVVDLRSTHLEVEKQTLETDLRAAQTNLETAYNYWQCILDLEEPGAFRTSISWR